MYGKENKNPNIIKPTPWLSIIIPIYNAEKYLNKCLDTIYKQTFTDYEVIMVDDGSTDNSPVICQQYEKKDSRFSYIRKNNGGVFQTRIFGAEAASGKYFTYCDADDYYVNKNALQNIFDIVNENDCSILQFGFFKKYNHLVKRYKIVQTKIKRNKEEFYKQEYPKLLCSHWPNSNLTMGVWNKVYQRKLLDELPDSSAAERIFWGDDLIINLYLMQECESMCFVPDALYCYRQNSGGTNQFSLTTMHDLDSIKKYQIKFLKEYQGEEKDRIENIMFSEIADWFYYYIQDARKNLDDDQVRKLIAESLELPSFRIAREYYLNRNEGAELVDLLRNADVDAYMMKTKDSVKKPTVKETIIKALKKAYKAI